MKVFIRYILVIIVPFVSLAQTRTNAAEILKKAELKRIPWIQMSTYATIADDDKKNPGATYHLFFDTNKVLVACMEPYVQRGNLLLMQNHEMWLYIKSTAQPAMITPLQRLSGAVSFIDIAGLKWSTDYKVDSVKIINDKKQEIYFLQLHAKSNEISYRKINLWIDKKTNQPIKEDIYLSSDKLYKTIVFTKYEIVAGKEMNTQIEFTDHFNKERKTFIDFSKAKREKNLPANYFIKEKLALVSKEIISAN
jgi:outer membrane lipoprotein-sorting protein